jgi:hypothetical protein
MEATLGQRRPGPGSAALTWLGRGTRSAGRNPALALALYAPSASIALLTAAPMFLVMQGLAAAGPWAERVAVGDYLNVLLELGAAAAGQGALGREATRTTTASALVTALAFAAVPIGIGLQGLAYALVSGGVLARLGGDAATPFARLCARQAGPMVRFHLLALGLIATLGLLGALALALAGQLALDRIGDRSLGLAAGSAAAPLLVTGGGTLVWLGWVSAVDGLLEVGRADLVARADRGATRALGRALALATRPGLLAPAALVWLGLGLLTALGWALGVAVGGALAPRALLVGLALDQVIALAGAWLKVLRLAAAVEIARAARPEAESAGGI